MKKSFLFFVVALLLSSIVCGITADAANAYIPYNSYSYNEFEEADASPAGYIPQSVINSSVLGLEESFDNITDIVYLNGLIYFLDSNNSRILVLDENYSLQKEYRDFYYNGKKIAFKGALGLTVTDNGDIFIADTLSNRVICADNQGIVKFVITRPNEALNNTSAAFDPQKVAIDSEGRIFVATKSIALGLMVFDSNGQFIEFFGANEVLSTTQAIVKQFRKLFMNITQLELVEQATPVSITSMDFDKSGFLYTVSPYRDATVTKPVSGLIRKLNYKGNDILNDDVIFGDLEEDEKIKTWFCDIDIDDEGFLNILDPSRGRVFQYTDTGILVSVFGSIGGQVGCFSNPTALESVKNDILVCDGKKNCIYVFSPTEYGTLFRSAILKMNSNDLEGSTDEWNQLLEKNSNCYQAYLALGRICEYEGDYKGAMSNYKLAYSQDEYASAFQQKRQNIIEKNAFLIVVIVIVVIGGILFSISKVKKLTKSSSGSAYSKMEGKYTMPFYVLIHPNDGFAQFKTRDITSMAISFLIAAFWLLSNIIDFNFTGFAFSINRNSEFNIAVAFAVTIGAFMLFALSNWVVAALTDGKGTLKSIIATIAYSLIPYLISKFICVGLTNLLVPSESVFIDIISVIGIIWTASVLFLGLMTIHEYSVGKTIWALLLTILSMIIIVFLMILLYSLMQQLFDFIRSVFMEITYRTR